MSKRRNYYIIGAGFIIVVLIVMLFLFRSSFANLTRPFTRKTSFSTLKLDEEEYGDTSFDASRISLRAILDRNVETSFDNIIYIQFKVGGNALNDTEAPIYDIALSDLQVDCDLLSPYVKWVLYKNHEKLSEGSLDYHFDTIRNGRLVLTPVQQDLKPFSQNKDDYDVFDFYMWISDSCQEEDITKCLNHENQSYLMNKKLSGKIEVELYSKSKVSLIRTPSDVLDTSTCIVQ